MTMTNESISNPSSTISDSVIVELRKIIQIIDLNSKSLVKRVGLTGPQLVILREINLRQEASVGDIAKAVSLSQGTVTGILERMEKRDLVVRRRSPDDRRRVLVRTTEIGREIIARAPPLMQEAFVEQFDQLPDWVQTMILSGLQHLVAIMDTKAIKTASAIEEIVIADKSTTLLDSEPRLL